MPTIETVYETVSNFNAVHSHIVIVLNIIARACKKDINRYIGLEQALLLNTEQRVTLLNQNPGLMTQKPEFIFQDLIPENQLVFQASLQIGLIYLLVFTFLQFILSLNIQSHTSLRVKSVKCIFYRMIDS